MAQVIEHVVAKTHLGPRAFVSRLFWVVFEGQKV